GTDPSEMVYSIPGERTRQTETSALAHVLSVEKSRRSLGHAMEILARKGVEAGTATGLELNRVSSQVNALVVRRDELLTQLERGAQEGGSNSEEMAMELQQTISLLQRLRADLLGERQAASGKRQAASGKRWTLLPSAWIRQTVLPSKVSAASAMPFVI
ncbi:Type III effector HopR1, partial [Pseudomonas savastanoi pv. nerii]